MREISLRVRANDRVQFHGHRPEEELRLWEGKGESSAW
jgi:hypothetical protein